MHGNPRAGITTRQKEENLLKNDLFAKLFHAVLFSSLLEEGALVGEDTKADGDVIS